MFPSAQDVLRHAADLRAGVLHGAVSGAAALPRALGSHPPQLFGIRQEVALGLWSTDQRAEVQRLPDGAAGVLGGGRILYRVERGAQLAQPEQADEGAPNAVA